MDSITNDSQTSAKGKAPRQSAWRPALSFFGKVGVTALAVWLLLHFVFGVHICHLNSAFPTIRDGELCVTYRLSQPGQGTMIVYRQDGAVRFGRVIAFGGDVVTFSNDSVNVNDYGIYETNVVYPTSAEGSAIRYPYQVPDNCVFVLNDYRSDVSDSRTYGGIPLDAVEGAVVFTMRMRGI